MAIAELKDSNVWHDPLMRATWLIHMCNVTHPCLRRDSFICRVTWQRHSYAGWRDNDHGGARGIIRVTWLVSVWQRDSFVFATWLIHVRDMPHSITATHTATHTATRTATHCNNVALLCARHASFNDSFTSPTCLIQRLIHMTDMPHSMTHSLIDMPHSRVPRDSSICRGHDNGYSWRSRTHTCDTTLSCVTWLIHVRHASLTLDVTSSREATWPIHMCDVTHSCVQRDSSNINVQGMWQWP